MIRAAALHAGSDGEGDVGVFFGGAASKPPLGGAATQTPRFL